MTHLDMIRGLEKMLIGANPLYEFELKFSTDVLCNYVNILQTDVINELLLQYTVDTELLEMLFGLYTHEVLNLSSKNPLPSPANYTFTIPYLTKMTKFIHAHLILSLTYLGSLASGYYAEVPCKLVNVDEFDELVPHSDNPTAIMREALMKYHNTTFEVRIDCYTKVTEMHYDYILEPLEVTVGNDSPKYTDAACNLVIQRAFQLVTQTSPSKQ